MSKKLLIEKVNFSPTLWNVHVTAVLHANLLCCSAEHPGKTGMSREEHAGQTSFRPFHYSETWSFIYRTVDWWICLPESSEVMRRCSLVILLFLIFLLAQIKKRSQFFPLWCCYALLTWFSAFLSQTARVDKPAERGHWEAEEAACQEETAIFKQLPSSNGKLWAKATQIQGNERSWKWSLSKTHPTSAVSSDSVKNILFLVLLYLS